MKDLTSAAICLAQSCRNLHCRAYCLACYFMLASLPGAAAQEDVQALKQRFLNEAPRGWARCDDQQKHMRVLTKNTFESMRQNKINKRTVTWFEGKWNGAFSSTKTEYLAGEPSKGQPYGRGKGTNSKYSFEVRKNAKNSGWTVLHLEMAGERRAKVAKGAVAVDHCGLVYFEREALPEMIKSPQFTLRKIATVREGKEDWVRVDFSANPPDDDQIETPQIIDAWVVLDPQHCWVIRRGEGRLVFPGNQRLYYTMENSYREGPDGLPLATRAKTLLTFPDGGYDEHELEITAQSADAIPEVEFSLTEFGLPEPAGVEFPQQTRWYLWFALAALVFLAAGLGLYRFVRVRPAAPGASPKEKPQS